MERYDLIVLGGGNAMDLVRDVGAAGRRVALVERGPLGGTCPNRGCIPSKLLLAHADAAHAARSVGRFHVGGSVAGVDVDRILGDVRSYTGRFDRLLEEGLPESVDLFRGAGRLLDGRTVAVNGDRLRADRIVLATGSRPRRPDLPGDVPYWTSDEVFRAASAPRSVTIVGGGFVAVELAHFFHGVGVDTRMIVRDGKLLPAEDEEVRARFQEAFTKRVPVSFGSEVTAAEHDGSRFRVRTNGSETHETDALLYAIGRVPNSDGIGLEEAGVELDARGFVRVDDRLRTSAPGIHAMGDLAGRHMFTHAASFEATYLARQILGGTLEPIDYGPMPHAVFTEPEVAGVGATERELRERGQDYVKAAVPYDSVTKGRAIKEEYGLVKLLLDREGGILGCHIVGSQASTLLHEVIPVMKWRNHVSSLTGIIHVHPSLPEVIRGAARAAAARL